MIDETENQTLRERIAELESAVRMFMAACEIHEQTIQELDRERRYWRGLVERRIAEEN